MCFVSCGHPLVTRVGLSMHDIWDSMGVDVKQWATHHDYNPVERSTIVRDINNMRVCVCVIKYLEKMLFSTISGFSQAGSPTKSLDEF